MKIVKGGLGSFNVPKTENGFDLKLSVKRNIWYYFHTNILQEGYWIMTIKVIPFWAIHRLFSL